MFGGIAKRWTSVGIRGRISLVLVATMLITVPSCASDRAQRRPSARGTPSAPAGSPSSSPEEVSPSPSFEEVAINIGRYARETCAHAVTTSDPSALIAAFINARLSGRGAEGCLSRDALASYCSDRAPCADEDFMASPGPICLYRCNGYHITGFDTRLFATRNAHGTVVMELGSTLAKDDGYVGTDVRHTNQYEGIRIRAGYPFQSNTEAKQVIVEVSTCC